jgi:hypothetical protein
MAEYSYDDLKKAFIAADAAGDAESARMFAERLVEMQQPAESEYASPIEGMSQMERFVAGLGAGMSRPALAVGQLTPAVSQADIDEYERLNAPLMGTTAGKFGSFVGEAATLFPFAMAAPATIPWVAAGTIPGAAAGGALVGALSTPGGLKERAIGSAIGGVAGPVAEIGGRFARGVSQFARSVTEPLLPRGPERIAARTIQRMATDPTAVTRATQYQPGISGYQPSLAEATLDPGIAQLQRGLPEPGGLALAEEANINAAVRGIQDIAQTPQQLEAAISARSKAANPLYRAAEKSQTPVDTTRTVNLIDRLSKANPSTLGPKLKNIRESLFIQYAPEDRARDAYKVLNDALAGRNAAAPGSSEIKTVRTIVGRVRDGKITADDALSQLKGLKPKRADFRDALSLAKDILKTPDYVIQQGPRQLMDAAAQIQELAATQENKYIRRELRTVQKSLEKQIAKAVPEFGQAEKVFAQASAPVNQMQIGQQLYESLVPPLAQGTELQRLTPAAFARAAGNMDELARSATKGPRGIRAVNVMTPEQMNTIEATRQALARREQARILGAAPGSPTAQNLATENILRRTLGPIGFPQTMLDQNILPSLQGAATVYGKGLQALGLEKRVQEELTRQMTDPARALAAYNQIAPAQGGRTYEGLLDYITPAFTSGALGAYNP